MTRFPALSSFGIPACIATCVAITGCTSLPAKLDWGSVQPIVQATVVDAGIRDLRGMYRAALCARLQVGEPPCEEILHRLAAEPPAGTAQARSDVSRIATQYRIAFAPGIFSECLSDLVRPFADVENNLLALGIRTDYLNTPGRGTSRENAAVLAQQLGAFPEDGRRVILVAHSKGMPDALQLIADYPGLHKRIAAVVSVAGAVNGTYLADNLKSFYRTFLAELPVPHCKGNTGDEIADLEREARMRWWFENRQKMKVPIFTIVAAPDPERVSPAIRATYRALAAIDPRNDGQLVWYDQIAPGSYLLGYINADHWAIANPLVKALPFLELLFRDDVPRTAVIEAAAEVVAIVLARKERR